MSDFSDPTNLAPNPARTDATPDGRTARADDLFALGGQSAWQPPAGQARMSLDGQMLGDFQILSRIGQGGMGAVYKARQVSLDRLVALKTLQDSLASDPEFIARFRREAKAAAALNHTNLVQVHAAGETDGLHWFAMEFVEGESAQSRLRRKGRLELAEAIAIATHVATALEYGWRKAHLIHRDIKPDNIFLSNDGEVKLGDLGLAKSVGTGTAEVQSLTMTGSSMGTPHYISPEQGQGKKDVDFRADIYSLGCTLYHLASGQPPYAGDTALAVMMQHVTAPVPNLGHALPGCPQSLAVAVMKMMAKNPAHRPQAYADVLADLRRAYDDITGAGVADLIVVSKPPARSLKQAAIFSLPDPQARPAARPPTPAPKAAAPPADIHSAPTMILPSPDAPPAAENPKSKTQTSSVRLALIAAAVAVLGIAAFFIFGGKKEPELSEAERAEKAKESSSALQRVEPSAASVRPDGLKSPPASPAAEQWRDILHDPASMGIRGKVERTLEGVTLLPGASIWARLNAVGYQDAAVRMTATFGGAPLTLEGRSDPAGNHYFLGVFEATRISLNRWDQSGKNEQGKQFLPLTTFPLPAPLEPGRDYQLEFRAVGQTFSVTLNGKLLGTFTYTTLARGGFGVSLGPKETGTALIKSLEVLDLDPPGAGTVKLWDSPEKIVGIAGASVEGGVLRLTNAASWGRARDAVVRVSIRADLEAKILHIRLRDQDGENKPAYIVAVYFQHGNVQLRLDRKIIQSWPMPRSYAPGEWVPFEFRAVGDELSVSIEGRPLGTVRDAALSEPGRMTLYASPSGSFREITYLPLDVPAGAKPAELTTPPTATKDKPFVNTLGMKFVPVPGTKVLFSIWDTRVQDYAAYAAANPNVDGAWKTQQKDGVPCGRELNHPVVGVSWDDAQGFCQWLTEKEAAAATLPKDAKYRLPTDAEWSTAVGLRPEQGATPEEKHDKTVVDFPWGTEWPPPKNAGNYADETFHAKFPPRKNEKDGKMENAQWMKDYTDGHATTSPVGVFPANACGLYDMGGNVWRWCEDWWNMNQESRVLRGGSWSAVGRRALGSSYRNHNEPGSRFSYNGFRCVLEPAPSSAAAPAPAE